MLELLLLLAYCLELIDQDASGGGKDKAEDAADYGRERARAAQDRFNRGYENTPTGGDIRREGERLTSSL